jgi:hypothetical protein
MGTRFRTALMGERGRAGDGEAYVCEMLHAAC